MSEVEKALIVQAKINREIQEILLSIVLRLEKLEKKKKFGVDCEGMKLDDMESGCNHPALWKDGKCRVCGKQMLLLSSLTKPDNFDYKKLKKKFGVE